MILQTKRWLLVAAFPFLLSLTAVLPVRAADAVANVRPYAIDCGRIGVSDMSAFADTGELDGKPASVVASCFLIRHPKGTLLWDTGLSDKLAENKGGVENGIFKLSVTKGLVDQLKTIDISPSEITFLAFSHLHFDHTGNANAFDSSTWILNKDEVAWAEATPTPRLRQKASEKRPGHPAPTRAWHDVQLFDEQHQAAMLDAGDAVGEASAEAARPFYGDQQWRAGLESNIESPLDLRQIGCKPVL